MRGSEVSSDSWSCGQGGDEVSVARFIAGQRSRRQGPHTLTWSVTGFSDRSLLGWVLVTCIVRLLG